MEELERLWKGAGGEPPLPAQPMRAQLDALRGQAGQELAQSLLQQGGQLEALREEWKTLCERAAARMEGWRILERLRAKAAGLSEAEDLEKQARVIREERRLLDATDPVQPLRVQAAKILRGKVNEAASHFGAMHQEEMKVLESTPAWKHLSREMQEQILRDVGIWTRRRPPGGAPRRKSFTPSTGIPLHIGRTGPMPCPASSERPLRARANTWGRKRRRFACRGRPCTTQRKSPPTCAGWRIFYWVKWAKAP